VSLDGPTYLGGLAYLLAPAVTFLIAAGSPGPATLAVAATAMARGRSSGLALGAGLAAGLALWGAVAAAGLGALMLHWTPALLTLRIAGGAFLIWLAWKSARSAMSAAPSRDRGLPAAPQVAMFLRGLLLNVLNPKAVLAWTAVIAIGLPSGAGAAQLCAIVAICAVLGAVVYGLYAVGFSIPVVTAFYWRARRGLEAAFAAFFGYAGVRLMFWRVETP
jgi:threonine/homoserine/homoserine lactone efflux protein